MNIPVDGIGTCPCGHGGRFDAHRYTGKAESELSVGFMLNAKSLRGGHGRRKSFEEKVVNLPSRKNLAQP